MQDLVVLPSINFTEVFNTKNGAIYQSDSENCWYIDFAGKLARFDYRNLLKLKKAYVNSFNYLTNLYLIY